MKGILFFFLIGACLAAPSSKVYLHEEVLADGAFIMRWTPDVENNVIDMEFEVTTTGWVGVTFLYPSGIGQYADTLIAGVFEDGTTYVQDRYTDTSISEPNTPRPLDVQQDWTLHSGVEADGKTIVQVSRPLDTGDIEDNPVIVDSTMVLGWAYDDQDIVEGIPLYHGGFRGSLLINLLNPAKTLILL